MENHLGELWSRFHFLMPGVLGGADAFREQFRRPFENGGEEASRLADMLSRRISPFILDALLQLRLICCDPRLSRNGGSSSCTPVNAPSFTPCWPASH